MQARRSPRSARIVAIGDARSDADVVFPIRDPEPIDRDIKRLRRLVRDGIADGHPLRQRRPGRASRRAAQRGRRRSVARGARRSACFGGGFVRAARATRERGLRVLTDHEIFRRERRIRRARRYASGVALETITRAQAGRLRRAPRARRRHLSRDRDDLRRTEHDRGRGHRVRGRRPAQRAALSHRSARALSLGDDVSATTRRRRGCTSSAASAGRSSATRRAPRSRR